MNDVISCLRPAPVSQGSREQNYATTQRSSESRTAETIDPHALSHFFADASCQSAFHVQLRISERNLSGSWAAQQGDRCALVAKLKKFNIQKAVVTALQERAIERQKPLCSCTPLWSRMACLTNKAPGQWVRTFLACLWIATISLTRSWTIERRCWRRSESSQTSSSSRTRTWLLHFLAREEETLHVASIRLVLHVPVNRLRAVSLHELPENSESHSTTASASCEAKAEGTRVLSSRVELWRRRQRLMG